MSEPLRIASLTVPLLISGVSLIAVLKLNLFKQLNIPVDLGKSLKGKRVFGANKTYRGISVLVLTGTTAGALLHLASKTGFSSYIHPFFNGSPIFIGLLFTAPYVLGELTNSFIKRKMNIPPGGESSGRFKSLQSFFDLADGIIFTALFLVFFSNVNIFEATLAATMGIVLHYLTDIFMKRLRLKH